MREIWKHQAWILLVTGLAVLTNLGSARLWDEDEPKNATCAAEMLARGDWIVPTFNGELRTDKPILLYWFMLPLYHLFGVTELSARLTSAMCGLGTALLTYHIGRRLFRPEVGLWAGILLGTSLMFGVASRAATPDALLIFFCTLSLWFFVQGSTSAEADASLDQQGGQRIRGLPTHWGTYAAMYGAMAMAVLAKGPVGVVLPTAVIGLYLLMLNPARPIWGSRNGGFQPPRARWLEASATAASWLGNTFWPPRVVRFALAMRPQTALAALAIVAVPWYVVVGMKTDWAWPAGFFWRHNVGRYMAPMEGHHGPPFYHLLSLAIGFFPGSIFLVPMVLHVWRELKDPQADRRGYLLALSWIGVFLAVFSLAGTKLPSYVTPTYPALALLTGAMIAQWIAQPSRVSRPWVFVALSVYGAVGVGIAVGVTVLARRYFHGEQIIALLGLIPMAGAAAAFAYWRQGRSKPAAVAFAISATAFSTALFGWALLRIDQFQEAVEIQRIVSANSAATPHVATYRVFRPSWVFYMRRRLVQYTDSTQASESLHSGENSYLLVEESRLAELKRELPAAAQELGRVPRFLKPGTIVVLGVNRADASKAPRITAQRRDYSRLR